MERDIIADTWPCPAWCESPRSDGHFEFDSWSMETGAQIRPHRRTFYEEAGDVPVGVALRVNDELLPSGMTTTSPVIQLCIDRVGGFADVDLTGPAARGIAAALIEAADAWEAATG